MITRLAGSAAQMPRAASMPSIARHADVQQRHVGPVLAGPRRRPSAPSPASATTAMSGWASRIIAKPLRTSSWSSATTTRIVTPGHGAGVAREPRETRNPAAGAVRLSP